MTAGIRSSDRPVRIGMIVPSSNTCLEPQSYRMLAERIDVTVHFTRVEVTRIALDDASNRQFELDTMTAAAQSLRTADVDVIAWNGTSGSWLGADHDRAMVSRISEVTGLPATTSTLAYLDAFTAFGLRRLALLTPYTADVNDAIARVYGEEGLSVVSEHHLGLAINEAFARVVPEDLVPPSMALASDGTPDALIYLCTNLYGAPVVEKVELASGIPVLDSVAVTLWKCLKLTGTAGLDSQWGKLLV